MATQSCPSCDIMLEDWETHCPRCGLRVAALPRQRAVAVEHTRLSGGAIASVLRGLVVGAALLSVSVLIAMVARLRGGAFALTLDNAASIIGGLTLCLSFFMGGVRTGVLTRGVEVERRLLRTSAAPKDTRIVVATAGGLCVAVGLLLLPVA